MFLFVGWTTLQIKVKGDYFSHGAWDLGCHYTCTYHVVFASPVVSCICALLLFNFSYMYVIILLLFFSGNFSSLLSAKFHQSHNLCVHVMMYTVTHTCVFDSAQMKIYCEILCRELYASWYISCYWHKFSKNESVRTLCLLYYQFWV
jgi:hypothetical protein